MKDENKLDVMADPMQLLHKYVPTSVTDESMEIPGSEEVFEVKVDRFHLVLIGGDPLTVARAQGTKQIRANLETRTECLPRLVPVVKDWHAPVVLVSVSQVSCSHGWKGDID